MALIKNKITRFGFEAGYWKITKIELNIVTCKVNLTLSLFKDRDWRNQSPEGFLEAADFSWTLPELFSVAASTSLATIIGMAYAKIKEPIMREKLSIDPANIEYENINWFSDAEDVFEL